MQVKEHLYRLNNPDFHVCDHPDCLNSYTPYKSTRSNDRYCLTHGTK